MLSSPPWRKLLVVAGLTAAIGLVGCSNSPSSSGNVASIKGGGATSTSADPGSGSGNAQSDAAEQDAMVKFAQCMRQHGINMPDPTPSAGGRGAIQALPGVSANDPAAMQKMQAASTACDKLLPNGGKPTAQDEQRQLKFAQCMRAHGVDMPDPNPNPNGTQNGISINMSDPKTKAALSACEPAGSTSGK
ncbi:MAG TPA: hypothetical protein VHZ97_27590 [Pseudonocardiaceae bacterium]|jgi:uncharacterized protein (DUF305 family)|nr:hypothetical protein [Pseudonocardiaceae bacterium]